MVMMLLQRIFSSWDKYYHVLMVLFKCALAKSYTKQVAQAAIVLCHESQRYQLPQITTLCHCSLTDSYVDFIQCKI